MSDKQWVFDNPQESADLIEQQQRWIAKLEQRNNELDATVERLREVVRSAVSVFSKYECDVDDYPTLEHRAFMETLKEQCK